MRPYFSWLGQFRRLLCVATMSSVVMSLKWILRSRGATLINVNVSILSKYWTKPVCAYLASLSWVPQTSDTKNDVNDPRWPLVLYLCFLSCSDFTCSERALSVSFILLAKGSPQINEKYRIAWFGENILAFLSTTLGLISQCNQQSLRYSLSSSLSFVHVWSGGRRAPLPTCSMH